MRSGWEIKTLGETLTIERGGSPRPIEKYLTSATDGINWIKISDATASDKFIYTTKEKITQEGLPRTRLVHSGDFILSNSMSFGRPYIMKTTGCIHDGWLVLKQDKHQYFDIEFLYYLLSSPIVFEQFNSKAAGSTVRNLNISLVSTVSVPIPPLPEQKRIVSILDEAFSAIATAKANAEQNLKNAKELFESYLQSVFESKTHGKKFETLESLCDLVVDCEHKTAPIQETGYPSIRTPNIGKGQLLLDGVYRVSEETYKAWTRRAVPQADDLILAREAPAGNIAVIPENIKVCLGQRTVLIRPKKNRLNSKYLASLILSKDVQMSLLSHSVGATVEHVNMKDIRAFKIYDLSPLEEQSKVVSKLDALSNESKRLESIYQQKITDLEEMKKSILQKAFSGKLNLMKETDV